MSLRPVAVAIALLFAPHASLAQSATQTTLSITSGGSPAITVRQGTAVTLTATVSLAGGGAATAPGQVNFCEVGQQPTKCTDIRLLATAQLSSAGSAVYKFIPGPGTHTYQAIFLGTRTLASSSSISSLLTVTPYYTTVTSLSATSLAAGYTLTATVTGSRGTAPPTGTVTLEDASNGNYILGTAPLVPGTTTSGGGLSAAVSQVLPTETGCLSAAVADINGDGKPDLILGNFGFDDGVYRNTVEVFLGNGDGTFVRMPSIALQLGVTSISVADVNGDGKPDLVAFETLGALAFSGPPPPANSSQHPQNTIQILLGNGDGTFAMGQAIQNPNATQLYPLLPPSGQPFAAPTVGIADFNGDGIPDLAIAEGLGPIVEVFFGNGDGTFKVGTITAAGLNPTGIAVGDFNGDGKPDLAVTQPVVSGSTNVIILLGNGDGNFTPAPSLTGVGPVSSDIVSGDFNDDGLPDLAVESVGQINVFLGDGHGNFTQAPHSPILGTAQNGSVLAVGDFNGDGIADLVTSSNATHLSVLLGNGDGTFQPGVSVVASSLGGPAISGVALGDLNGSGLSGIVSADDANYAYALLPQAAQTTATATATLAGITIIGSGNHNIIAIYSGDSIYQPSTSAPIPLGAVQQPTTVTLAVSPTSSNYGQPVLMTATLSPITAQGYNATGTITFSVAGKTLGTVAFVNGVATFTSSLLPLGTDTVSAAYSGDANFAASGGSATEVVTGFPSASALTSTPNPSFAGQTVTITAAVTGVGSTVVPAGTVTFYSDLTIIGQATLDANGHASTTISTLSLGLHTLTFVYSGSLGFIASTSPPVVQLVNPQGSTTTLTVAPNPAGTGQPVALTAAVSLSNTGTAIGTITFFDGATQINQSTLDASGHATYTTSSLALGTHSLTAVYAGNASYGGSTSPAVSELIETLNFSMTLASPNVTLPTYQHTTTSITLASLGSFADNVNMSCGNLPAFVTCIFTPTPAVLASNGTATVSFYLDTDSILGGSVNGPIHGSLAPPPASTRLALLLSPFTLLTFLGFRSRARRPTLLVVAAILTLPVALLLTACGSSVIIPIPAATPGTYTIPITATGASTGITHSTNLTLQITP